MKVINTHNSFFPSALLLIFITLKLTGHITWSWLWVLSPFWIPLALVLFIGSFAIFMALFTRRR